MRRFIYVLSLLTVSFLFLTACGRRSGGTQFERGVEALREGHYVAARAHLEKAISSRPGSSNNALAYNLVGIACWRLGEKADARLAFENSRNLDPTLALPAYNLGVLAAMDTQYAQASALFHEAALLDQADPRPLEYMAHLAALQSQWDEARTFLSQALDRAPLSARILTALALVELHTEGPEIALARLGAAIDADPDYAPAYFDLALVASDGLHDPAEAVVWLEKYLAVCPDGEHKTAAAKFQRMLKEVLPAESVSRERPSTTDAHPELTPPEATGNPAAAEQTDRRRQAVAAYNQGTIAHARKEWDRARLQYRLALEKDGSLEQARMNLATLLHAEGKDRKAIAELRTLIEQQPGHARAHYLLGSIYAQHDATNDQAAEHYRTFIELRPNDPSVERIRQWLDESD